MSSDSDEAPEEVTFNESKLSSKLAEQKLKLAAEEQLRKTKDKRRARDQKLKETHKRKLLSEILNESNDEAEEEPAPAAVTVEKPIAKSKKKTFVERGDVRIELLDPKSRVTKKKLPPSGADAVRRREKFLFRDSVPRK